MVGVVVSKLDALKVAEIAKDIPQNVNFAIRAGIATTFLDANGITFKLAEGGSQQSYFAMHLPNHGVGPFAVSISHLRSIAQLALLLASSIWAEMCS